MFSRIFLVEKIQKVLIPKKCQFLDKKVLASAIFEQFLNIFSYIQKTQIARNIRVKFQLK